MLQPAIWKSSTEITGIFTTGVTGCGKSTLMNALRAYIDPSAAKPWIIRAEMSDIIEWGKKAEGDLGEIMRQFSFMQDQGRFLPSDLIERIFYAWLEARIPKNCNGRPLILGSGFPRTMEQLGMLNIFSRYCVVHLIASKEFAHEAVLKRHAKTPEHLRRADDAGGETVFKEKWSEYENQTLPAIASLRNIDGRLLEIDRAHPLEYRIGTIFRHMERHLLKSPLTRRTISKSQRRLRVADHPAHSLVQKLLVA